MRLIAPLNGEHFLSHCGAALHFACLFSFCRPLNRTPFIICRLEIIRLGLLPISKLSSISQVRSGGLA